MHADNTDSPCESIAPLLVAYALGERDEEMRNQVIQHTQQCPLCRQMLVDYQRTAGLLPLAVPAADPCSTLRGRVLAAVAARCDKPQPRPVVAPPAPVRGPHLWRGALWAGRLLAAVGLVALLAWNVLLHQQLARQQALLEEKNQVLGVLLEASSLQRRTLIADTPAPQARGSLVLVPEEGAAALVVEGLPALPANKTYQIWLVADGQRTSCGTFRANPAGESIWLIQAPHPLQTYDAVGVTIEPEGGSPGPTSPRVIGAPLN